MQSCKGCRKPSDDQRHIFVGDRKQVEVETIWHFRLLLGIGFKRYFHCIIFFRQNLVSYSLLDIFGCSGSFVNNQFYLSLNLDIVGTSFLIAYDKLDILETITSYNETLHVESCGTKHILNNENAASLRHK